MNEHAHARDPTFEKEVRKLFMRLEREMRKVIVGEDKFLETLFIALASEGSVIAESPPGEGKSLATQTIAKALELSEGCIEFSPDILPQDILGYVHPDSEKVVKGKIFNQIILAEELNRAPGKTKSTLLRPMQEHSVTLIDSEEILPLPRPFVVLATMNPHEREGSSVYPLTSAELNRFALRVRLKSKNAKEFARIAVRDVKTAIASVETVMDANKLLEIIDYVKRVSHVSDEMLEDEESTPPLLGYISRLAEYTVSASKKPHGEVGTSGRMVRSFWLTLNAYRVINSLDYLTPTHVVYLIRRAWHHRIIAESEERRSQILDEAVAAVPVIPETEKERNNAKT